MPLTFNALADALKARLDAYFAAEGVVGVTVYAQWPDAPITPPAIVVQDDGREPLTMTKSVFKVRLFVGLELRNEDTVRRELRDYLDEDGSRSIQKGIAADGTLGGVVADCYVTATNTNPQLQTLRNRQLYFGFCDLRAYPL